MDGYVDGIVMSCKLHAEQIYIFVGTKSENYIWDPNFSNSSEYELGPCAVWGGAVGSERRITIGRRSMPSRSASSSAPSQWGVAIGEGRRPTTGRRSRSSRSASSRVRCVFFQTILTVLQHVLHFQG
uniref:Uncharacterized protein n=1 Tax=Aegilops tauschii subsp. strangulata TaxID=200361 RepID=A0A453CGI7_AEGTS